MHICRFFIESSIAHNLARCLVISSAYAHMHTHVGFLLDYENGFPGLFQVQQSVVPFSTRTENPNNSSTLTSSHQPMI